MYIDYKEQPTETSCGQTCVSMIVWKSVEEVMSVMNKKGLTRTKDLVTALKHFDVKVEEKLKRIKQIEEIPNLCIIKLKHIDYKGTHWVVFHEGVFFDPSYGIISGYDDKIKLLSYLKITEEPKIQYK